MADLTERKLGYGFGLLGGALILLGGLVGLIAGAADLVLGRPFGALAAWSDAVVLFVVGGLAVFFSYLGRRMWKDRTITSGVLLVVIAAIGWGVLGLGTSLFALIGAIFVFVGGILFLVEPVKKGVTTFATT